MNTYHLKATKKKKTTDFFRFDSSNEKMPICNKKVAPEKIIMNFENTKLGNH